jgi:hypothetical protein
VLTIVFDSIAIMGSAAGAGVADLCASIFIVYFSSARSGAASNATNATVGHGFH